MAGALDTRESEFRVGPPQPDLSPGPEAAPFPRPGEATAAPPSQARAWLRRPRGALPAFGTAGAALRYCWPPHNDRESAAGCSFAGAPSPRRHSA